MTIAVLTHLDLKSSAGLKTTAGSSLGDALVGDISARRLSAVGGHSDTLTHVFDAAP